MTTNFQNALNAKELIEEVARKSPKLLSKIKASIRHMKNGFQMQYSDAMIFKKLLKVEKKSITQMMDYKRIRSDLLKMIPFSLFISIPLMEILLPPYLILFPNAVPKSFLT